MINAADMSNLIINRLPGIFTVGWHHNAVFATGHISAKFKDFLTRHIPDVDISYCFDDMKELSRPQSLDDVETVCDIDIEALKKLVLREIVMKANKLPLIIFGFNDDLQFIKSVKESISTHVYVVNTTNDLQIARSHFSKKDLCVIFLNDNYRIGADIKLRVDGRVLVFVPNKEMRPDREQLTQMMGRGQRSRGDYQGVVFICDDSFV
jgi:hypothetical protein